MGTLNLRIMKQTNSHLFFCAYKTLKRNFPLAVLCFTSCLSYSQATCIFSDCGNNLNGNVGVTATGIQTRTMLFSGIYRVTALGAGGSPNADLGGESDETVKIVNQ